MTFRRHNYQGTCCKSTPNIYIVSGQFMSKIGINFKCLSLSSLSLRLNYNVKCINFLIYFKERNKVDVVGRPKEICESVSWGENVQWRWSSRLFLEKTIKSGSWILLLGRKFEDKVFQTIVVSYQLPHFPEYIKTVKQQH